MANLTNCATCGRRERPSDVRLIEGRYICDACEERYFAMFDDPRNAGDYIRSLPTAQPRDLFGEPLSREETQ